MFHSSLIAFLTPFTLPLSIAVYSVPIVKWIYAAIVLMFQITQMILSISFVWLWELALNTELIDAFAFILSLWISTSLLLEIFSYEIVITLNANNELEQEPEVQLIA